MAHTSGTNPVCLVHLVSLMQPNKPDRPNRPYEQDRLADFFSILLEIIRLYALLPKRTEALVLGKQLLRSGTSVGAHY